MSVHRSGWRVACWLAALVACSSEPEPSCPAPTALCGPSCVDVTTSRLHCGACGRACGPGELCAAGRCAASCPVDQQRCGDACVDVRQDRAHCGRCGNACGAGEVCAGGACDVDCGPLTTCAELGPGGAQTLYCASLALDRNNCGACGAQCPQGHVCRGGRCRLNCPAGQLDCGGRCVDPQTDRLNCGACGAVCAGGFECARGRCTIGGCPPATTLCAGSCVDLQRDRNHCGACLAQCPSGYLCAAGECRFACAPGESMCGDGCADLMNDARNCGMCGRACAAGELCRTGACSLVCQEGQSLCAGRCTDTRRDRAHCGACGRACAAAEACADGACRDACSEGQARCGAFCVDVRSDPAHCGMCGRACPAGEACAEGQCRAVGSVPGAGACPAPSRLCGGFNCTDVRNDNAHCGACGRACPGDQLCFEGACVRPCAAGEARCPGGACASLDFDAAHCGACGNACPTGQSCVRGQCGPRGVPTRYEVQRDPAGVAFVDACAAPGAARLFAGSDEGEERAALPFPFRYWSTDFPADAPAFVSVNGFLSLSGSPLATRSIVVPSTTLPNALISPHGGDLQNVDPLCVAVVGVAPLRRWVIEWSGAQERGVTTSALAFEAVLSERSDTVDFIYQRMDGGSSRYTGLESPNGVVGASGCPTVGTSTTFFCLPTAGTVLRFVPAP